jgi:hypothetical protein
MTISPVPLAMVSLNVAARLLFGAIVPTDWSLTYAANEVPADNSTSKVTAKVTDVAGNPETSVEHLIIIDTIATAKPKRLFH